ncbi:hypothetical protein EON63_07880 [archaeon]|nr:MAG: hypothetical protein EON63_07880 [archaeon]
MHINPTLPLANPTPNPNPNPYPYPNPGSNLSPTHTIHHHTPLIQRHYHKYTMHIHSNTIMSWYHYRYQNIITSRDGPDENVVKIKPPLVFGIKEADLLVDGMRKALEAAQLCKMF